MRDIKFKVYDKDSKHWIDESGVNITGNGDIYYSDGYNLNIFKTTDLEILFYTGLKDINSKEIFEGDIVEASIDIENGDYNFRDVIIYQYGAFGCSKADFSLSVYELKIIGNIFDNSNLLNNGL